MTDLTARRTAERCEPGPAPDLDDRCEPHPADPPSVFPDGVELSRLVARAQLTAAQALELGAGVLAAAERHAGPDPAEPGGEQVLPGPVVIGADGRVVVDPAAHGRHDGDPSAVRPAGPPVAAVLADIAGVVRPRARAGGPVAEQLVAELDRAVADLPVAGIPAVAGSLREAAAVIDRRAVRAEIGALVRVIGAGPGAASVARPTGGSPPAVRAAPGRVAARGRSRTSRRRIGAWLLSVLVVTGVVLGEVGLLRDHIAADLRVLLDAGRGTSAPSTAAKPDGPPVAAPAPAAAGRVLGVDLRALAPCAPGSPCTVRLAVRLTPAAERQVVTWSYRVLDRCTGATHEAPGGTVALPAGVERAAAVGTVALPSGTGVAVVAVTGVPAAAASQPVVVGSCPTRP